MEGFSLVINIILLLFTAAMVITSLLFLYSDEISTKFVNIRKIRMKEAVKDGINHNRILDKIAKKTKPRKRYNLETLCLQAGYNISYSQLIVINFLSAVILASLSIFLLNNIAISFTMLILGYLAPIQILTLIKNRRAEKIELQVGPFMQMVLTRYDNCKNFADAMRLTENEFKGEEPIYSEIRKTNIDIKLGVSVDVALRNMARRMGSRYIERLSEYYAVMLTIGTDESRTKILKQPLYQYNEFINNKMDLSRELAGPKRDAYIMLFSMPALFVYQLLTNENFLRVITVTTSGQIGIIAAFVIFFGSLWFINNKIGAPLE